MKFLIFLGELFRLNYTENLSHTNDFNQSIQLF